jgi:hypothetical protein
MSISAGVSVPGLRLNGINPHYPASFPRRGAARTEQDFKPLAGNSPFIPVNCLRFAPARERPAPGPTAAPDQTCYSSGQVDKP